MIGKNHLLLLALLIYSAYCFGTELKVLTATNKLVQSFKTGDYIDARITYQSAYPSPGHFKTDLPTDVLVYGQITSIDESIITISSPSFWAYFNDKEKALLKSPIELNGTISIHYQDIKTLVLDNQSEHISRTFFGFGFGILASSPVLSSGFGKSSFKSSRFESLLAVSAISILTGWTVFVVFNPGIYQFQELNGRPYFWRYKKGQLIVE